MPRHVQPRRGRCSPTPPTPLPIIHLPSQSVWFKLKKAPTFPNPVVLCNLRSNPNRPVPCPFGFSPVSWQRTPLKMAYSMVIYRYWAALRPKQPYLTSRRHSVEEYRMLIWKCRRLGRPKREFPRLNPSLSTRGQLLSALKLYDNKYNIPFKSRSTL